MLEGKSTSIAWDCWGSLEKQPGHSVPRNPLSASPNSLALAFIDQHFASVSTSLGFGFNKILLQNEAIVHFSLLLPYTDTRALRKKC